MLKLEIEPTKISKIQERLYWHSSPGFDAYVKRFQTSKGNSVSKGRIKTLMSKDAHPPGPILRQKSVQRREEDAETTTIDQTKQIEQYADAKREKSFKIGKEPERKVYDHFSSSVDKTRYAWSHTWKESAATTTAKKGMTATLVHQKTKEDLNKTAEAGKNPFYVLNKV